MRYDIVTKGRSHLYDLAIGLQKDRKFNKLITCWPKYKFRKLKRSNIESHFYIYALQHFLGRYTNTNLEKHILNISCKKPASVKSAIVDINLAGNLLNKYKTLYLDHPTTSYEYQIEQWSFEEQFTGIKIQRLEKLKSLYSKNNMDDIYSQVDKIIVPSISSKKTFSVNLQQKVKYIPFWLPKINNLSFRIKQTNPVKNICFIGIICPSKGLHYLVDALNDLNFTVTLHLFGNILSNEYKEKLSQKANCEMFFYGHIPQHELYKKVCGMDLAVMPSVSEGLPLSYLQALSLGVPIIASKDSSLEEIIGIDHIYPTRNIEDLSNKLEHFFISNTYIIPDNINEYTLNNYIDKWRKIL